MLDVTMVNSSPKMPLLVNLSSLFPKPSWKWHCPNHQCCPRRRIICHPWYVETNPHFHRAIRPSPCTDIVRTMTEKTPSISICHNNTILGLFTVHRQFTGSSQAILHQHRLARKNQGECSNHHHHHHQHTKNRSPMVKPNITRAMHAQI